MNIDDEKSDKIDSQYRNALNSMLPTHIPGYIARIGVTWKAEIDCLTKNDMERLLEFLRTLE